MLTVTDTERLNLLIGLRRFADAEKAAREAIGRDANWGPGYTHLARTLMYLQRGEEAIEAAREGVRKSPQDAWALGTLACALNWFNRTKESLEPAEQAVKIDPTYAWAYAMLANILFNLNRIKKARQAAIDGLKYEPDSESLIRWKGWSEHSLKLYDEALATAEAAVAQHPNSHLLLNLLGSVKWSMAETKVVRRLGLHREADRALADAVRLSPTDSAYRGNQRDNAVSARSFILQTILPLLGIAFLVLPSVAFAALAGYLPSGDARFVPLVFSCLFVVATAIPRATSAAALTAPLDRFNVPRAPVDDRERKQGRAEWVAYLIFFAAPYGAMVCVLAKAYGS